MTTTILKGLILEVIREMSKRVEDEFSDTKFPAQLRRRQKLRDEGRCLNCGKKSKDGKNYCKSCSKKIYDKMKNLIKSRREAGLCIKCAKSNDSLSVQGVCPDCQEKIKKYDREWRAANPEAGWKPNRPTDYAGPEKQDKVKWEPDEFSDLENQVNPKTGKPYTRQYIWQKRMTKRGKCILCGEPVVLWRKCQKHATLEVMRQNGIKSMDDPKIQKWMTKHGFQPDYMIESP